MALDTVLLSLRYPGSSPQFGARTDPSPRPSTASIHSYVSDDAAVGKVVSFFTSDEEAKNDIDALKNRIAGNVERSREQLARAKSVKSKWVAIRYDLSKSDSFFAFEE